MTRLGEGRAAALGMVLLALGIVPLLTGSIWFAGAGMVVMGVGIPVTVVAWAVFALAARRDTAAQSTDAAGDAA